jgi:hypothetical protein
MNERRALLAFLLVDLGLGVLLAYRASLAQPVLVVPGVKTEQIVVPGVIPEPTLANFALLFALNFENYTTATLETQDRYALALVSPRFFGEFEKMAAERRALVRDSQLASAFFPDPKTIQVKEQTVVFRSRKQHVIGERLSWEAVFDYQIQIERVSPTQSNPYGLAISGYRAVKVEPSHAQ